MMTHSLQEFDHQEIQGWLAGSLDTAWLSKAKPESNLTAAPVPSRKEQITYLQTARAAVAGSLDTAWLSKAKPYAAPLPMDEMARQATVGCLIDFAKDEDPALLALCELVTRPPQGPDCRWGC